MTALAEIRGSRTPQGEPVTRSRSGLLVVSRTTIDYTPQRYIRTPLAHVRLHPATAEHSPGDKVPQTLGEFGILFESNGPYEKSVGGNGTNIGHRASEFGIPVTVLTWGNEKHRELLEKDLNHPRKGMRSHLIPIDREIPGATEMPEAIVFPVRKANGMIDRIILGTQPPMSSEFAQVIDKSWDHIVINSLGEPNWRQSLRDGVDAAVAYDREFTFTPGSALIRAVRKDN